MKKGVTLYRLFLLVFILVSCKPGSPPLESQLSKDLDSLIYAVPEFSGVVLLAENGRPLYHKAFGYRTFQKHEPLDTTSIFELASVSKQFTAMIIMMLKEDGLLNYDDAIEKYIPGLPYPGISIRHLLNHTSGLPDYQSLMDQHWDKSKVAGNIENIEYLKQYHPSEHFIPGEKFEYSNTGYMLLASVAEKVSGKDFIQLCRERIFQPLQMRQTDIRTKENKVQLTNTAWGHVYVAEKKEYLHADSFPAHNYSIWLGKRTGPGRVSATASDLLKWDQALYSEKLIKKESLEEAYAPALLNDGTHYPYGFGWQLTEKGNKVFHAGDNPGYKTIIVRLTDKNKTLIMLCNNAHEKFDYLVEQLERELMEFNGQ